MPGRSDWQGEYRRRLMSAEDAMSLVGEDDLVKLHVGTPSQIAALLETRARSLDRLNVRALAPGYAPLLAGELESGERELELFIGDAARPSHDARRSTYLPSTFMLGMKAFDSGRIEARMPDVSVVPCSPPNEAGYVHFGPHHWLRKSYLERCRTTIAFVDPEMMPVHGDVWAHVSQFTAFVEGALPAFDLEELRERVRTDAPPEHRERLLELSGVMTRDRLAELAPQFPDLDPTVLADLMNLTIDPAAQAIADHLKELVRDGDTIQVGVGTPSSMMFRAGAFDEAHDLGLHTELGSPGLARLWDRGILNNSRKTIHRNRAVAVAWSGCDAQDLEIIRDNPAFELYDPSYLLNPRLDQQRRRRRPDRAGGERGSLRRQHDQRHWRTARHPPRGDILSRRTGRDRAAFDGTRGVPFQDRRPARARHAGDDPALPGRYRDHRARRGPPARQEPPATCRGVDQHRPPRLPGRTDP